MRVALIARDDLAFVTMHRCCPGDLAAGAPKKNCRTARFKCAPAAAAGTRTFHMQFTELRISGPRRYTWLSQQKAYAEHLAPGPPFRHCFASMRCHEERQHTALGMELYIAHPPIGGGIARGKPYGQAKRVEPQAAARPGASATSH